MAKQKIIPIIYKVDYSQVDKSTASVKKAEIATDKLNKEIAETESAASKSFGGLKNAILASGITVLLGSIAKKVFDIGVQAEQTAISFNTFLGSAERGKKLLADLTKFSIVTPFTPDQVNKAAKSLLAFGVDAGKIIPTLKILGDVSSGTGKDLSEMAIIFGQIRSTGRLMGQDLLQLINAGFNPLQIISQKTGKSVGDLKAEMEKGLITFDMVEQAFRDATSEGGLFFNLMEKQSATVGGKLSTVAGNIEEMEKKAFQASHGGLSDLLDVLVEITGVLAETEEQRLSQQGINLTVIEKIFGSTDKMAMQHKETKQFLNDLTSLYNLAVSEIAKEGKDGIGLKFMTEQIKSAAELRGITITMAQAQETATRVYEAAIETHNEGTQARNKETEAAILQRQEQAKKIISDADEAKSARAVKDAQDELAKSISNRKKALELLMSVGKRLGQDIKDADEKDKEDAEKRQNAANDRSNANADRQYKYQQEKLREAKEEEYRILEEAADRQRRLQDMAFNYAIDSLGMLLESTLISRDEDFESQREKFDREIELAGDNERRKSEIRLREQEAEKSFREKQKKEEQQNAIKRIGIDTAINVIRSITNNGGIPLGLPFGALAAAAGLFQIGLVKKFKDGVIDLQGPGTTTSDSIPAMLSRRESVMTAQETIQSGGILKAIRAKKLDDRIIDKLYKKAKGSDGTVFNDERIVQGLNRIRPDDVIKKGSYLYDVKRKNADHVEFVRRKYLS